MKGSKANAMELEKQGWVHIGSFKKSMLLFIKGEKIIGWNYKTSIVELEGELK